MRLDGCLAEAVSGNFQLPTYLGVYDTDTEV